MKDQYLVKTLEAADHLYEHLPYVILLEKSIVFLVFAYLLKEITGVGVLHNNAKFKFIFSERRYLTKVTMKPHQ